MDRRQQKTRAAILHAFSALLAKKDYHKITVQDIIDSANVGRATFYDHFPSKDDLLQELCGELFDHIIASAMDRTHTHGLYAEGQQPRSIFWHLLQHLQENDDHLLELLGSDSSEIFLPYFKDSLNGLVSSQIQDLPSRKIPDLPTDFLVDHISSSFVEMVLWWTKGGMVQSPEELDRYFRAVTEPIL